MLGFLISKQPYSNGAFHVPEQITFFVFFSHSSNITILLLVYVDDMPVIGNDPSQVLAFLQYLHITLLFVT